eukprot:scaffold82150_cov60-Phaeocystis_antarctica.AAC.2
MSTKGEALDAGAEVLSRGSWNEVVPAATPLQRHCYAIPRCPGPSHPDTKVRCTGDDDSPLKT